ncbi:MAG: hypothetical protein V4623_10385 [Pseudomonadota bacterium]
MFRLNHFNNMVRAHSSPDLTNKECREGESLATPQGGPSTLLHERAHSAENEITPAPENLQTQGNAPERDGSHRTEAELIRKDSPPHTQNSPRKTVAETLKQFRLRAKRIVREDLRRRKAVKPELSPEELLIAETFRSKTTRPVMTTLKHTFRWQKAEPVHLPLHKGQYELSSKSALEPHPFSQRFDRKMRYTLDYQGVSHDHLQMGPPRQLFKPSETQDFVNKTPSVLKKRCRALVLTNHKPGPDFSLKNFPKLRDVTFHDGREDAPTHAPTIFQSIPQERRGQLKSVTMRGMKLNEAAKTRMVDALPHYVNLEKVDFSNSEGINPLLKQLGPKVKELRISNTGETLDPDILRKFNKLEVVEMPDVPGALAALARLEREKTDKIKTINLAGATLSKEEHEELKIFLGRCPSLENLNLADLKWDVPEIKELRSSHADLVAERDVLLRKLPTPEATAKATAEATAKATAEATAKLGNQIKTASARAELLQRALESKQEITARLTTQIAEENDKISKLEQNLAQSQSVHIKAVDNRNSDQIRAAAEKLKAATKAVTEELKPHQQKLEGLRQALTLAAQDEQVSNAVHQEAEKTLTELTTQSREQADLANELLQAKNRITALQIQITALQIEINRHEAVRLNDLLSVIPYSGPLKTLDMRNVGFAHSELFREISTGRFPALKSIRRAEGVQDTSFNVLEEEILEQYELINLMKERGNLRLTRGQKPMANCLLLYETEHMPYVHSLYLEHYAQVKNPYLSQKLDKAQLEKLEEYEKKWLGKPKHPTPSTTTPS